MAFEIRNGEYVINDHGKDVKFHFETNDGQVQMGNGQTLAQKEVVWDENTVYTNEMPTVSGIGGIGVGETFQDVPMKDLITKLLYPYIKPTISLNGTPNGGTYEKGQSVPSIVLNANVGKKSEKIKEVKFYKDSSIIHTESAPNENGGVTSHTYSTEAIVNDVTFKADCTDTKNSVVTSNVISFKFYYPAYIGEIDAASSTPTQEEIKALTKKVQAKGNLSNTYTITNKRMVIACPPGWTISKILDPNSFDVTSSFAQQSLSITGLDGTPQTYTVYVSEPTTQSNFKMTFNV